MHLQVFSLFHVAVLFLRSQDVIRGEHESEPGTWRSQRRRSAEKLSESGYSSSSQLGKEENIHYKGCANGQNLLPQQTLILVACCLFLSGCVALILLWKATLGLVKGAI